MATTPNMSLTAWNSSSDYFNFSDLVNNWDAIDNHDHTSGKGVKIPAGGLANDAVTAAAIAGGSVTQDKLASASVGAAQLVQNSVGAGVISTLPSARVYNDANISIPTASATPLTFNTQRHNGPTGAEPHSTSTNPGRLTTLVSGVYLVTLHIEWAANATGVRRIGIVRNGAEVIARQQQSNQGGSITVHQSLSTSYKLSANDYVTAQVYQDSGSSINVLSSGSYSPEFTIVWQSD